MASGSQPDKPGQPSGTGPRDDPQGRYGSSVAWIGVGSPVPAGETMVTARRVVQYIIDDILAGIVPGIVYWLIGGGRGGVLQTLGWLIAVAVWILIMIWYWVIRPFGHGGQTFGMQLLGLRIVSKDGDRADRAQLVIRWILLIIDTLFLGLAGLITMLCSRYRQRIGDHAARTLVVRASWRPEPDSRF